MTDVRGQDLRVSAEGRWVFMADASFWRRSPAIVVYDAAYRRARRVLEAHASVSAEDIVIRAAGPYHIFRFRPPHAGSAAAN